MLRNFCQNSEEFSLRVRYWFENVCFRKSYSPQSFSRYTTKIADLTIPLKKNLQKLGFARSSISMKNSPFCWRNFFSSVLLDRKNAVLTVLSKVLAISPKPSRSKLGSDSKVWVFYRMFLCSKMFSWHLECSFKTLPNFFWAKSPIALGTNSASDEIFITFSIQLFFLSIFIWSRKSCFWQTFGKTSLNFGKFLAHKPTWMKNVFFRRNNSPQVFPLDT